jgi:hypothetical protein
MDALAITLAVAGLILASHGHVLAGASVSVSALVGLAVALFRRDKRRRATILPFSFASHFVVMPVCFVGAAVLQAHAEAVSAALFGSGSTTTLALHLPNGRSGMCHVAAASACLGARPRCQNVPW